VRLATGRESLPIRSALRASLRTFAVVCAVAHQGLCCWNTTLAAAGRLIMGTHIWWWCCAFEAAQGLRPGGLPYPHIWVGRCLDVRGYCGTRWRCFCSWYLVSVTPIYGGQGCFLAYFAAF